MEGILDRYCNTEEHYEIRKAAFSQKSSVLQLEISGNHVLPYDKIRTLRRDLLETIPELNDVFFHVDFSVDNRDVKEEEEERIRKFLPYMKHAAESRGIYFVQSISNYKMDFEGDEVVFYTVGEKMVDALNEQVSSIFGAMMRESLGLTKTVRFVNDEEEYASAVEETKKAMEACPVNPVSKIPGTPKPKASSGGAPVQDPDDPRILGRPFKEEPTPMKDLPLWSITGEEDKMTAVVAGEIFELDEREIKNNKTIVNISFSDGTSSMRGKMFLPNDKWAAVSGNLKKGAYVRIRGVVEFDSFEGGPVLLMKDILKDKKVVREDHADKKRVELHAHTKMSSMDGLNEAGDLVKQAIAWGQPAVAITDHGVVQSFPTAAHAAGDKIKVLYGMEGYLFDDSDCIKEDGSIDYKKKKTNHVILLAKTQTGLMNIYKLVSISHMQYFYRRPRLPKSVLEKYREGIIVGSACEAGEVFAAIRDGLPEEKVREIASFYDYLEIQPIINNSFMLRKGLAESEEELRELNRKVLALGDSMGKLTVATTDAHYRNPEDYIYRNILMAGQGFQDVGPDNGNGLYMRTTEEMLEEFSYLGEDRAYEIVVENTNKIAEMCDGILPVPKGKFPPKIEHSEDILRETCEKNMAEKYGSPAPDIIRARLEKELESIIGNGYAVMYVAAMRLVEKSMSDGYLVGSRGSVGSSFAATMAGITEVNPLAPHYICPHCKHLEWGDENEYDCGVDMPEKTCPECGTPMDQEGFAIPFETFLGFYGDKEPDIDLNFASDYQAKAQKYVEVIFGEGNVYKAGTIGTIAGKTAFGYVKRYFDEQSLPANKYEINRLTEKCTGVKRTTGQHPGGVIVVPRDHQIYEFCPIQHPANDADKGVVTTHFDYHSIDENLLKLDILGHETPSMIRQLQDMTGLDPLTVKFNDQNVMGIFNGIEGLEIKNENYKYTHGSLGIPEFGTSFVRQMLDDTQPKKFADLVRISGFSHGTDVWINNAQEFIRNGQATMKEAISTRDDIMNYLILKGVPKGEAFQIMEKVRKGKGVTDERVALMQENGVPEWYIESCRRIKYMFPRAHAVAYVMMSYRMAYYKVYYPREFYAVYFTSKIADFNWDVIQKGAQACLDRIAVIDMKGKSATAKEADEKTVLQVCYEMYSRGFDFAPPLLGESKAIAFDVKDGKVLLPICALRGVGETVGRAIEQEYKTRPFATIEDMRDRAKVNKTAMEALREAGLLDGMQEADQFSLF